MRRLAELLQSKQISSTEIVRGCLERIEETEPVLNAFITVDEEGALAQAAAADRRRAAGEPLSPWDGIPLAVKDNISTSGLRTTCASRFLRNYTPIFDATVVERVKRAGLTIAGKTNLDEFAMGSSTEIRPLVRPKTPMNPLRVAGAFWRFAAAVCRGRQVPLVLGHQNTVNNPHAREQPLDLYASVRGINPVMGGIRYGAVALVHLSEKVKWNPALESGRWRPSCLCLIAGADPRDAVSAGAPGFPVPVWDDTVVRGLRVGVPEEFFSSGLNEEVEKAVKRALQNLADQGAVLQPISLPTNEYAIDTYLTLVTAEASSCLARFDGVRYGERVEAADANTMFAKSRGAGFGHEVKRRIMLGTYVLSASHYEAYYEQAQKVRTLIKQDVARAFQEVDVIVTPTTPTTAFKIGEKRNPLEMYLSDLYTATANLSGVCALSLPCGVDSQGLPIGLQIIAREVISERACVPGGACGRGKRGKGDWK